MTEKVIKILRMLGFNRAVGYGVLTRAWGVLAGPISIMIIAIRFSKEQQGFYYTINSLLAMQIFFELGLTGVIATFASHEFANLRWCEQGRIEGDPHSLSRFTGLLSKSSKWFGIAAILLAVALMPVGLIFFGTGQSASLDFGWRLPWILAVLGTALNLMVVPFFAIIMGSGDVVVVNHREMIGGIIGSCISWLVMGLHGGLYAACAVSFGNVIISWSYLLKQKPELLKLAWRGLFANSEVSKSSVGFSWKDEIWPLQWRSAIAWCAGYFIFQIFTPVLFKYQGASVAGQMGMTMSACNALLAVCVTWISAKSPEFGKLVAQSQWFELDQLFFRVLKQSFIIVAGGAISGWGLIFILQQNFQVGQRFLPAQQVAFLLLSIVIITVTNCFAIYLRAHKREPFMYLTIFTSILSGISTLVLGKLYSSFGIILGFLAIMLFISLPTIYYIWSKCRIAWHD
ncbi:MAG: hypothetical protein HXX17_05735 [Geobacteraceae bacterium]|nr:hypothetical protein [Geobacteraceae bacterium]